MHKVINLVIQGMDGITKNMMQTAPKKSRTKEAALSSSTSAISKAEKRDALFLSSSSTGAGVDEDDKESDEGKKKKNGKWSNIPIPVEQFDSTTYKTMETFTTLGRAQIKTGVKCQTIHKAMKSKPEGRTIHGRSFGFRHPTGITNVGEDSDEDEISDTGYVLHLSSVSTPSNHDDTSEQVNTTRKRKLPISVSSDMKVLDAETLRRMQEESVPAILRDMNTIHQSRKQPIKTSSSVKQYQ